MWSNHFQGCLQGIFTRITFITLAEFRPILETYGHMGSFMSFCLLSALTGESKELTASTQHLIHWWYAFPGGETLADLLQSLRSSAVAIHRNAYYQALPSEISQPLNQCLSSKCIGKSGITVWQTTPTPQRLNKVQISFLVKPHDMGRSMQVYKDSANFSVIAPFPSRTMGTLFWRGEYNENHK